MLRATLRPLISLKPKHQRTAQSIPRKTSYHPLRHRHPVGPTIQMTPSCLGSPQVFYRSFGLSFKNWGPNPTNGFTLPGSCEAGGAIFLDGFKVGNTSASTP